MTSVDDEAGGDHDPLNMKLLNRFLSRFGTSLNSLVRASGNELASPGMRSTENSYCDNRNCHQANRCSFGDAVILRFISVAKLDESVLKSK